MFPYILSPDLVDNNLEKHLLRSIETIFNQNLLTPDIDIYTSGFSSFKSLTKSTNVFVVPIRL